MRKWLALAFAAFLCLGAAANGSALDDAPTDRVVRDRAVTESSGLARSPTHDDVLWTHNDSGNPARLYAIGRDGRTRAVLSVDTGYDFDWEAIATLRGPDGTALIAVADIGDNTSSRKWAEILLIREPARLESQTVTPVRTLRFRYPGGGRDAEALLADPRSGRLYIVSKLLFGARLYEVPPRQWPGRPTGSSEFTLRAGPELGADLVTDGTSLPDGRMLVRSYGSLTLLGRPEDASGGRLPALAVRRLPAQEQGESLTLTADGKQALIGSEGVGQPVLRVPVPATGKDPDEEFPDPTSTSSGTDQPVTVLPRDDSLALMVLAGSAALLALAGAAAWNVFRR